MAGKLIAAVVVGCILGIAGTSAVVTLPEAQGQAKEKKQQWEYQVVYTSSEGEDRAKAMTERYNALAADGWEYIGPVIERTQARAPNGNFTGYGGVFVLFKRPK